MAAPDVMGVGEIAERLGVTPERARTITRRRTFPEPYERITLGRIWLTTDIEEWIRAHWPER
jgi:prophage regulatory protein